MTAGSHVHQKIVAVLAWVLASSAVVRAQESSPSIETSPEDASTHLTWVAPRRCPTEAAVRALAVERLRASREPGVPLLSIETRAEVVREGRELVATLRAGEIERRFHSPSCRTVARAVALVFATWVIDGPREEEAPVPEPLPPEPEPEPVEATSEVAVAPQETPTPVEAAVVDAPVEPPLEPPPPEETIEPEVIPPPAGRGLFRFIGGLLLGLEAGGHPVVEPTAFLSIGFGYDVLEIDVGPLGMGLTSFGQRATADVSFITYGGRLRVGLMAELSHEWELGGHLLTEIGVLTVVRPTEDDAALFATFGAGLDLRFYPLPFVGVGFSVQVPFPVGKSTVELPGAALRYELDWWTIEGGIGLVVRIS